MLKRLLAGTLFLIALNPEYSTAASWSIGPPENLSEAEKAEWYIGLWVGFGRVCGFYAKGSEVSKFMNNSPYFRRGVAQSSASDGAKCTPVKETLDKVLGDKEFWTNYIRGAYPEEQPSQPREADATPPSEQEVAVLDFIDEHKSGIRDAITSYNQKHKLIGGFWDDGQMYKVKSISGYTVESSMANKACVAFSVTVGQYNPKGGVLALNVQWAGDQVEIIGHDCH